MAYLYILYSLKSDIYYVGVSENYIQRFESHNSSENKGFTSKHQPWVLKSVFEVKEGLGKARKLENFIKRQKSRKLIEQLCNPDFVPEVKLAQLVRVPQVRD